MFYNQILKLGTRKSPLALWQTKFVKNKILHLYPQQKIEIIPYQTTGDKIKDVPLYDLGGKGLFTKELEIALKKQEIDFAVQSVKDIPGNIEDCFDIPIVFERENALDALLSLKYNALEKLPLQSKIGTSSPRRASQLLNYRKDLQIIPLRGNIETRIVALKQKKLDAILLAVAGLQRMNFIKHIVQVLPSNICVPAIGQGIIGLECLKENTKMIDYLKNLNHQETYQNLLAERIFLKKLHGNCHSPIAAHATTHNQQLTLKAFVGDLQGKKVLRKTIHDSPKNAIQLGSRLADWFITRGAQSILS